MQYSSKFFNIHEYIMNTFIMNKDDGEHKETIDKTIQHPIHSVIQARINNLWKPYWKKPTQDIINYLRIWVGLALSPL